MKIGDLVRFYQPKRPGATRGCLPYLEDDWGHGLIQDVGSNDGNVNVLWPDRGVVLTDKRFLEVVGGQSA